MQLTQRKRKDSTVILEEKVDSAFCSNPRKADSGLPIGHNDFPEPKAESALGSIPGKPSRLFLLTRFSRIYFFLSFEPLFGPCILKHIVPLLF